MRLRWISNSALSVVGSLIACSETAEPPSTIGGTAITAGNGGAVGGAAGSTGAKATGGAPTGGTTGGTFAAGGAAAGGGGGFGGIPAASSGGLAGGGSAGGGGTSGGASGSSTGGAATGGAPPVMCTPPEGNNRGFTTRFWDCCKPSCGWPNNAGGKQPAKSCNRQNGGTGANDQSACSGGGAFACFDYSPWAVSEDLSYGYAAFNGAPCGTCFELKFTGESNSQPDDQGAPALCGKRMIVQVVNIGGIEGGQFDLMIPGGGVGDFNACSNQWGVQDDAQLGERYGGLMLACQRKDNELEARKACTLEACNSLFSNGSFSQLLDGCKWTVDWLNTADNPRVVYEQVNCPQELLNKSGLR